MDLYKILGVDRNATKEELKSAYRALSKIHHPDVEGGDSEKFKGISEAYDILSDPEKRIRYDSTGSTKSEPSFDARFMGFISEMVVPMFESKMNLEFDFIKEINLSINKVLYQANDQIKSFNKKRDKLDRVLTKLTKNGGGENIMAGVIRNKSGQWSTKAKMMQSEIDFIEQCKEAISEYSYSFENSDRKYYRTKIFFDTDDMQRFFRENPFPGGK